MGYYIKIGRNDGNIGGLSSKGYHIVRKGLSVFRTYGAVEINGRNKKRINWCKGYQIKEDKFSSVQEANRFKTSKINRRLSHGYEEVLPRIYFYSK